MTESETKLSKDLESISKIHNASILGYHESKIPKGIYGQFNKIEEEFLEAKDAFNQLNSVLLLVELSDLIGAIQGYVEKRFNGCITLDDLLIMNKATQRAFASGARKPRAA